MPVFQFRPRLWLCLFTTLVATVVAGSQKAHGSGIPGESGTLVLSSAPIFGPSDHFDCPQVQKLKVKVMQDMFKIDADSVGLGQRLRDLSQVSPYNTPWPIIESNMNCKLMKRIVCTCLHQMPSKPLNIQSHKSLILERYSEKVNWAMLAACLNNRGQTAALSARKRLHINRSGHAQLMCWSAAVSPRSPPSPHL